MAVSGGGSLAAHLDDFYEIIGLQIVNGWGLTEVRKQVGRPAFLDLGGKRPSLTAFTLGISWTSMRPKDQREQEEMQVGGQRKGCSVSTWGQPEVVKARGS